MNETLEAQRLVVHKYGGTSLAGIEGLNRTADIIAKARQAGEQVVVVASAMRGPEGKTQNWSTEALLDLAAGIVGDSSKKNRCTRLYADTEQGREVDALVAIGEMLIAPALALMLMQKGVPARSFNALQAGLKVRGSWGKAKISDANTAPIERALREGKVPVLAGFQGSIQDGEYTNLITLGRGCSDTTAVAIAAALDAKECLIYTDVAGVYSADPRIVPDARVIPFISYTDILETTLGGAQVLQPRSLFVAQRYSVPLRVLSSFEPEKPGTRIGVAA